MIRIIVGAVLSGVLFGTFIGFFLPHGRMADVPVYDPWKGPMGKYGTEGELIGNLHVNIDDTNDVSFVTKDNKTAFKGKLAWWALTSTMQNGEPPIKLKVVEDDPNKP